MEDITKQCALPANITVSRTWVHWPWEPVRPRIFVTYKNMRQLAKKQPKILLSMLAILLDSISILLIETD